MLEHKRHPVAPALHQEEDILRRQQQKTRADISRLVEVLKNLGPK